MAKISAKDATILINGYRMSPLATAYNVTSDIDPVEVTGFEEPPHNFTPGLKAANIALDMLWDSDAGKTHSVLGGLTTGNISLLPELYALGCPALSLTFMQANYNPKGKPSGVLEVGTIKFLSYGADAAVYYGVALYQGTITNTLTGTGVQDASAGAVTAVCGAVLHVFGATTTDTYVIKVQHSPDNSTWADLLTFAANGTVLTSERQIRASGTINQYRRVIATRTGSAGNNLSFTVVFFKE